MEISFRSSNGFSVYRSEYCSDVSCAKGFLRIPLSMLCYVTQVPFRAKMWPWDQLLICRRIYFQNSWMTRFSDPNVWCECSDVNECVISAGHANMHWQGKVRFDGYWRRQKHRDFISPSCSVLFLCVFCACLCSRKQRHARLPFRRKNRYLELAVLFVLVLKRWPLGGCAARSYVNAQSRNNLSQPAVASYELWNPAKTLEEQSHSLYHPALAGQVLSQSNCLHPVFQCSSISCLHVPSLSVTTGYNRMQASMLADSVTGVLDSCFTVG